MEVSSINSRSFKVLLLLLLLEYFLLICLIFCYLLLNLIILTKNFKLSYILNHVQLKVPVQLAEMILLNPTGNLCWLVDFLPVLLHSRTAIGSDLSYLIYLNSVWQFCCLHIPHSYSSWYYLQWMSNSYFMCINSFTCIFPGEKIILTVPGKWNWGARGPQSYPPTCLTGKHNTKLI